MIQPVIQSLDRELISITIVRKMMDVIIFCRLSYRKKQNYLLIKYNSVCAGLSKTANRIFRDSSRDTWSFEVTQLHPLKYHSLKHFSPPVERV